VLSIDASGKHQDALLYNAFGIGTTLSKGSQLGNDAAATVGQNQQAPYHLSYGRGWKTDATAASRLMSIAEVTDPETGAAEAIGVHKWIFGSNNVTPSIGNELVRYEWGDRLGATFNNPATAAYRFAVKGLPVYANNAAAVAGGLTAGMFYRTGGDPDPVCVVH
jgi:hypothetical protein